MESNVQVPVSAPQEVSEPLWRQALRRICIGMLLCLVQLQIMPFTLLLPAVGLCLQLLGFRVLRQENRWFGFCWALSILRCALFLYTFFVNRLLWRSTITASLPGQALAWCGLAAGLLIPVCLWLGLRAFYRRAEIHTNTLSTLVSAVLIEALFLWLTQGIFLICLLVLMLGLHALNLFAQNIANDISESGVSPMESSSRCSGRVLCRWLALLWAALFGLSVIIPARYPMNWQPLPEKSPRAAAVQAELLALGYPETLLSDLSEEDLLACEGAQKVLVQKAYEDDSSLNRPEPFPTDIAVQLTEDCDRFQIFHHFSFSETPRFRGTEAISISARHTDLLHFEAAPTGRVLYGSDTVYSAPFYAGYNTAGDAYDYNYSIAFSYPKKGDALRCYVSYPVRFSQPGYAAINYLYARQIKCFPYPFYTAQEFLDPLRGSNLYYSSGFPRREDFNHFYVSFILSNSDGAAIL